MQKREPGTTCRSIVGFMVTVLGDGVGAELMMTCKGYVNVCRRDDSRVGGVE